MAVGMSWVATSTPFLRFSKKFSLVNLITSPAGVLNTGFF